MTNDTDRTTDLSPSKQRIRDTAALMFARGGYDAVSMRDLAEVLGIAAPSIYSHYVGKEALLEGICEPYLVAVDGIASVAATLSVEAWVEWWLQLMQEQLHAVRLMYGDAGVRRLAPGLRAANYDYFFESLLAEQAGGPRLDPALARVLVAATRAPFLNIAGVVTELDGVDHPAKTAVLQLIKRCCEQPAVMA